MVVSSESAPTPNLPAGYDYRPDLRQAATAQGLKNAPRHRWFYFPHSYSPRLVHEIVEHWALPENPTLADNFVGSGTTLVVARERGIKAVGYDLSPLAVMATNAKLASYRATPLKSTLNAILNSKDPQAAQAEIPQRLTKAFTRMELVELLKINSHVKSLSGTQKDFFQTALLSTARQFSRAVPDGGWFRWKDWPDRSNEIRPSFQTTVVGMIDDVSATITGWKYKYRRARLADARRLPLRTQSIDGLITSPPYANRHDYSRIFQIELLLMGSTESQITHFRHKSLRSHVEARRQEIFVRRLRKYRKPQLLKEILTTFPDDADKRIRPMLEGYFEDIFLSLQEVHRILKHGGQAAYIVGNVRHFGVMVPVDEIIGQIAKMTGLLPQSAWVMRLRGNSAQQMREFGREPSRESVLFIEKACDA